MVQVYAASLTIWSFHFQEDRDRQVIVAKWTSPPIPNRRPIAFDADMKRLSKIVVEHLGVEADKVTENARFMYDLGADSLDTVELVMAFEEEFDCHIKDDAAERIVTVRDAVNYLRTTATSRGL